LGLFARCGLDDNSRLRLAFAGCERIRQRSGIQLGIRAGPRGPARSPSRSGRATARGR
jgi:hypothetical protein